MPTKKYTSEELKKLSIEELQRISNDLDSGERTTRSGDDRACGANNIGDGECAPDCNLFNPIPQYAGDPFYHWDGGDCCPETCLGYEDEGSIPGGEPCGDYGYQCHNPCSINNIHSPAGTTCDCVHVMVFQQHVVVTV